MNNRQSKIINKIAQPIAKQLYINGWRNFEQIEQALKDWFTNDSYDFIEMTSVEFIEDFMKFLKEYKYE